MLATKTPLSTSLNQTVAMAAKPSSWLWIPYIWWFFTSTRALSSWIEGGRTGLTIASNDSGSPLDRALMALLIACGCCLLIHRGHQTKRILTRNNCLLLFFLFVVVSIAWSNFPDISIRRGIRSAGALIMALVVLTERSPSTAIPALLRRLYLVHIPASIMAIKYFRHFGVMYNWDGSEEEWTGIATDKNSLGHVVMCCGLFCVWEILRLWPQRKRNLSRLLLTVLLLALTLSLLRGSKSSFSSTALIGFAICSLALIGLQLLKKRHTHARRLIRTAIVISGICTVPIYVVFQAFGTSPLEMLVHSTGRNMTFTDRDLIWTDVLANAAKHPILGVGIGAYWVGPIGDKMYPMPNWSRKTPDWRPQEAHNGFLDVYVQLGAVGLMFFVLVVGIAFAVILRHMEADFHLGTLRLALLLAILISNTMETSFLDGTHGLWFLFILVVMDFRLNGQGKPTPSRESAWWDQHALLSTDKSFLRRSDLEFS
jgi:O-antigen ligase